MLLRLFCSVVLIVSTSSVHARVTPWIDFELKGGHISFPVTVSGHPTYAVLDSGAQLNAINKAFIGKHKLDYARVGKIDIKGVFGKRKQNRLSNIPVGIFGVTMELDNVAEISLGHNSKGLLLGAPLFVGNIVQIDYPSHKLRLISRELINLRELKNVPMVDQRGSGMPLVQVKLNGRNVWLILDTGNSGGIMIERSLAKGLGLTNPRNEVRINGGATQMGNVEHTRVNEVVFGPFTLENVLVSFNAEGSSINLNNQYSETGSRIKGKRVVGLIGYDVLKHFVLTMDYGRGQMHIGVPAQDNE